MASIDIFNIGNDFEEITIQIFRFQAAHNPVYKSYLDYLKVDISSIQSTVDIPYLPISFFKTHKVVCADFPIERVFKSSGTGSKRSTHYIVSTALYESSFIKNFERNYNHLDEISIVALLPNYQENKNSSLLYMVDELIQRTAQNGSTYLSLENETDLLLTLEKLNKSNLNGILIGVSFALLDLAERHALDLSNLTIMETGGMKGRRKEITRTALHTILKKRFNVEHIHSEYGMCELLSQAYSKKNEKFVPPTWMNVRTRPLHEPFSTCKFGESGILKIIDLANLYSCSFIETEDIGRVFEDGSFEVLGRVDFSALRGCNLMHV